MKKKLYSVAAAVAVGSLLLTGTFAWTNFNSSVINSLFGRGTGQTTPGTTPGGTLHNDFVEGKDYRDVYVENWGSEPMIVRIMLSEYMELGEGAGNRNGTDNHAVSIVEGALIDDVNTWRRFDGNLEYGSSGYFRNYWKWTMGGQKLYFPAPEALRGTRDANGVDFVSTRSPVGNTDGLEIPSVYRVTLNSEVISMDEWISRGMPIGHYWVVDTDGYSYWAAPLAPEEATGLLLHKVELVNRPELDFFYAINVDAHMATIDDVPDNYQRLLNDASPEATILVNKIADRIRNQEQQDLFEVMGRWRGHSNIHWWEGDALRGSEGAALFQSRNDVLNFVYEQDGWLHWPRDSREFFLDIDDDYFNDRAVLFVFANQSSGMLGSSLHGVHLHEGVLEINLHTFIPGGGGISAPSGPMTDDEALDIYAISIDRSLVSEYIHVNHVRSRPADRFEVVYTGYIDQTDTSFEPVAFQSRRELYDFFTANATQAWLQDSTIEHLRSFDNAFFNDRAIVLVSSLVPSNVHDVVFEYIRLNQGVLEVFLYSVPNDSPDSAMANHFFIVSIERSMYSETTRAFRTELTFPFF